MNFLNKYAYPILLLIQVICFLIWWDWNDSKSSAAALGETQEYNQRKQWTPQPDYIHVPVNSTEDVLRHGIQIDEHNGVAIYYNGDINYNSGRSKTADGYNLGLKYQCVEFVKRYYYQYMNHKMPDSFGHARDFFSEGVPDGKYNAIRGLTQYTNPSLFTPELNDILVFEGDNSNPYGHIAIVSKVYDDRIELVQQNIGDKTRVHLNVKKFLDGWMVEDPTIIGWLRRN